jgi:hypothetical protein
MATTRGLFEQYVNGQAARRTQRDGELIETIIDVARTIIAGAQVHWSGSQRKGTDVQSSDFDLCLCSTSPVSRAQRRQLAEALQAKLGRRTVVKSHAVRLQESQASARVDIAFNNAEFGNRPLADSAPFISNPARQIVSRALKLWNRRPHAPKLPGWVVEAIVLTVDTRNVVDPLALFDQVIDWLALDQPRSAILSMLSRYSQPAWNDSNDTPRLWGRVAAIRDDARHLQSARRERDHWTTVAQVGAWLTRAPLAPVKTPGVLVSSGNATSSIGRRESSDRKDQTMTNTKKPSANDQRADVKNPNNPAHKAARDNRANQLNPQHVPSKAAPSKRAASKPRTR